jgi:hypothetical protein
MRHGGRLTAFNGVVASRWWCGERR